jgi:hypothetical protein
MKVVTLESIVNVIRKRRGYKGFLHKFIEECKIIDAIPIKEGATNGDMVKAMFKNVIIEESTDTFHLKYETVNSDPLFCVQVSKKWWNAPYRKAE